MATTNRSRGDAQDSADQLENSREHVGDLSQAVQVFSSQQEGYRKPLKPRQVQMIAIGGTIGTKLFPRRRRPTRTGGPILVFVYALCGFFAFLVLRALGELVLHRPSSGSFVSYAREFDGEKMAYVAGWMYFLNWAMTAIVDSTAIALYVKCWSLFSSVPLNRSLSERTHTRVDGEPDPPFFTQPIPLTRFR